MMRYLFASAFGAFFASLAREVGANWVAAIAVGLVMAAAFVIGSRRFDA